MEFEEWYRTEHPKLVAWLCVSAGDVEVASDAAAEAFTRAHARWSRVAEMESPGGWVHAVAYNVVRRQLRRRALEARLLRRHDPPPPVAPPVLSVEVWEVVRLLPMRQRTAIALRYVLDLSQREIAVRMRIAPGTVSATLTAARARLAELLDDPHDEQEALRHDPV